MMTQIHVIPVNTKLLDFIFDSKELNLVDSDSAYDAISDFADVIHVGLSNGSKTIQIKWVIEDDSYELVKEYVRNENEKNNFI